MKAITITNQVTEDCNSACEYCYMKCNTRSNSGTYQDINTFENILKIFGKEYDTIQILWHGGEPLLPGLEYYKKIYELQKKYKNKVKITNSMQSNCIYLNEELLDFLTNKLKMKIGISIDGDREIQNKVRPIKGGRDSFSSSIRKIQLIKRKKKKIGIYSVISLANVKYPERFYKFLNKNRINGCKLEPCFYGEYSQHLVPTNNEVFYFYKKLFDLWIKNIRKNKINIDPFTHIIQFFETKKTTPAFPGKTCLGGTFCIKVDGTITPCANIIGPKFNFGNINKIKSTEEIFNNKNFKKLMEKRKKTLEKCESTCKLFSVCGGGCPSHIYSAFGKYDGEYPYCESRANLIVYIGKRLKEEHEKQKIIQTSTTPLK